MNSLQSRILLALTLEPMTVPQLGIRLMRTTKHVRRVMQGLRERGRVREVRLSYRVWGRTDVWTVLNAPVYELSGY